MLRRVRRLCLSLPETTEKLAWGAPTGREARRVDQRDTGLAWKAVEGRIREAHRLTLEQGGARKAPKPKKRAAHKR